MVGGLPAVRHRGSTPRLPTIRPGAATWGAAREEVLGHVREMVEMIVERLAEEGASVPAAPADQEPAAGERIVVTVCAPLEDAPHPA